MKIWDILHLDFRLFHYGAVLALSVGSQGFQSLAKSHDIS